MSRRGQRIADPVKAYSAQRSFGPPGLHGATDAYYSGVIASLATFTFITPAANRRIHVHTIVVSMDAAGYVEIRSGGVAIIRFEFVGRNAVPLGAATPFQLAVGANIQAYANGANAYVTIFADVH